VISPEAAAGYSKTGEVGVAQQAIYSRSGHSYQKLQSNTISVP
jgi:hypothetical protein